MSIKSGFDLYVTWQGDYTHNEWNVKAINVTFDSYENSGFIDFRRSAKETQCLRMIGKNTYRGHPLELARVMRVLAVMYIKLPSTRSIRQDVPLLIQEAPPLEAGKAYELKIVHKNDLFDVSLAEIIAVVFRTLPRLPAFK